MVHTMVRVHHEKELRLQALNNSKTRFLNVQTTGLSGRPHVALQGVLTTRDSLKLRSHLKLLCCDLLTGEIIAKEQGGDPSCRLCFAPLETTEHLITTCRPLSHIKERLLPELLNVVIDIAPDCRILVEPYSEHFPQFLVDCTSLNLPNGYRLSPAHKDIMKVFKVTRDWCYALTRARSRLLAAKPC